MKKFFFSYVIFLFGLLAFCQNPIMLKDVFPGNNSGTIQQIVKTTNYTFFNEDDEDADVYPSLFRTDGTAAGTIKLNLVYPTYISSKADKLTALGDKVIFAGDNSPTYGEIWASNGTQAGTIALERFQPTVGRAAVMDMTKMGSVVMYGVAGDNNHTMLKKTDGTAVGTSVVYDFTSFTTTPELGLFQTINGVLYFNLYDRNDTGVDQLWRSDGTTAGTYMLKDFGLNHYVASGYMAAGSLFYIMTVKQGIGNELWKSDGTAAGTLPVKLIGTSGNNNYPQYVAFNSSLLFAGLDASGGKELWITDGTDVGTHQLVDINPGTASSNPSNLTVLNGNIYFSGVISGVNKLLKYDGSTVSTVKDITIPATGNGLSLFAVSNNTILFRGITFESGSELWITDGTTANTLQVAEINPGAGNANPNLITAGNPVYFAANNGVSGFEVFKFNNSDGVLGLKNVWLTGAAFGEWKQEGVIKMTNNGGGIFTATNIQILGDGGQSSYFKFTEGTWATVAGHSLTTPGTGFPTGVTLLSSLTTVDNVITGTPGYWNVVYNYSTKAYSFTPTPPDNWGVVGTATPNGWGGPDMPLIYDAISNKWSAVVTLNDGEIKFRNNNNWSVNYGDDGADGSLDTNGANIAITGGRYLITLDFNNLTYRLTKESSPETYYVNDNSKSGDVFTWAIGNNNNIGTKAAPFATINYAISKAQNGDTIYVDAGTYSEDIIVNKSVTILGAKNGMNPGTLLTRGAESIIVPGTADPVNRTIVRLQASNINIDGFTIDGDNPYLTGSVLLNGVDINAGIGIGKLVEPIAHNNINIRNNIIKNLYRYGVFLQSNNALPLSGNLIEKNHFDNISAQNVAGNTGRQGRGIGLFNNGYASVKENVFTRNYIGMLLQGNDAPSAGSYSITGNRLETYSVGIQIDFFYPNGNHYLVNENDLTTADLNSWNVPGSNTTNENIAMKIFTIYNTAGLSFTNNKINTIWKGFYFEDLSNPLAVNNNSITGALTFAIQNLSTVDIDASCNWYGSSAVQDIIGKVTPEAGTYVPYLTNGTDNDLATGFQPVPDSCNGFPLSATLDGYADVTCNGANNGAINITVTSGVSPYTFDWTKEGDTEFTSAAEDPTNLAPGTYRVTITDASGTNILLDNDDNLITIEATITEPDLLTATSSGTNNLCFGSATGTASVTADGGTAPYTYLWNNGATTDEISNLSAGTYSVTVTDANGCTTTASYEVTQPTLLTASITNNSTACSNKATVATVGGALGYTYLWSNGATTSSINDVPVGTYTVTVTDANGCTATASISLTVGEAFNPSASVTDVSCFGGSNGAITVTNANGTAPFTFSIDGLTFSPGTFPHSFNNLSAGTYNIAVKDVNGCTGFLVKTISQPALLTATLITVQSTCSGQSTGAISVATAGGSGALSYNWTGTGSYTSSQKNISGLATGNYTLIVKDNNGCTASLYVYVPTYNPITVIADITHVLCRGSLTGAINLTVSGGSGSFAFNWTGSTVSSSEDISNLGSGNNYNVTITDIGSGCIITKSYVITQPASNLSLAAAKTNATGCGGSLGTITATASGGKSPYSYKLNNGDYQLSGDFTSLSSGSFTVWAKDANGCTSSKVVAITDNGSDQYESNNSKNQAKLIAINTTINARIALATDIADWFKFTTGSSGNYTLNLSHPTVNYTFNMYPSSNNAAALVPTSSTSTSKQYALTAGLTYYIQITGASSYSCYDLSISPVASTARYAAASTNSKVVAINDLSVKAYPNPHQGAFNLAIMSPEDGKAKIELFTILGQLLAKREVSIEKGQNTIIEFNDVGRGMILYNISIGDKVVNGKVFGKD